MNNFSDYINKNKKSWDKRTLIHLKSDFYDNNKFKKHLNSLNSIELEEIGNVKKKDLLHLQCHFGQDSISLANMGSNVVAVDFSKSAIKYAQELSVELNVKLDFYESNILNLNLNKEFDIIYTSYGVLGWLPDLNKWAKTISRHLKRGGLFLLVEFHPFIELLNNTQNDYFYNIVPDIEKKYGSYTDGGKDILIEDFWWNHSFSEIFYALESNGLILQSFNEYNYCPYKLEGMIEKENNKYVLKEKLSQNLPYVFSLKATKK